MSYGIFLLFHFRFDTTEQFPVTVRASFKDVFHSVVLCCIVLYDQRVVVERIVGKPYNHTRQDRGSHLALSVPLEFRRWRYCVPAIRIVPESLAAKQL